MDEGTSPDSGQPAPVNFVSHIPENAEGAEKDERKGAEKAKNAKAAKKAKEATDPYNGVEGEDRLAKRLLPSAFSTKAGWRPGGVPRLSSSPNAS